MERLTYWNCKEKGSALPVSINDNGDTIDLEEICAKLAAYEDTELSSGRVAELAESERYGRLVVLPCKIGQVVWTIEKKADHKTKFIRERFVNSIAFATDGYGNFQLMSSEGARDIFLEHNKISKTIFFTREAAEKALGELDE